MQLEEVLSRYGSCDIAQNDREALDFFLTALAQGRRYDLVCLDLKLPDSGGGGLLKWIRELERGSGNESPEVPVVVTTEYLSPRELIGAYYYGGCTDLLMKPIEKKALRELLVSYGMMADS